ncbi:MAG: sigma 54-interacting transcriptional regulator [Desulfobacteraceae bacterium]|nr:sigma 54-interacting transcriptional regulator [Desulfobacteraceae bacterium]MBC2756828.1 sigma 54-interacting transcriptional regulator [Desulfobacteraceae bacterium]
MIALPGYKITKEICRGNRRFYFDAQREENSLPVMIKTHFSGPEASTDRIRLQHEYELLKNLKGTGIPDTHAIESYPNGLAIITDPIDGLLLSDYMSTQKTEVSDFLKIAISAAKVLSNLHRQNIIHKDICPENMFINKLTHQIWMVDFRFATVLPREKPKSINLPAMEGSLAYMSPEQTGRMNRDIDYRTDFYSLGVLFYQILTGHLPFESTDPLELVHQHLAKQPEAPDKTDPAIPVVVAEIIMKLLSKNAEDRYLSGQGLIKDLKLCYQQYESTGQIEPFPLAEEDYPEKLRISQKIYGRNQEIEKLMEIFKNTSQGSIHMAVISGNPGVGKTSLVQEIHKPLTREKGYFIVGKFDPFHQNVPYSALVLAFQELVKQLLAESEENLRHWKVRLLSALGVYGQIIIDVIPDMELVIGPQPPVKKMDAVETRNRFNRVMMDFVRVFCAPEHPLVIFLDDLQWVDAATLKLIEGVMTEARIQHLFLIGSYRDNEVSSAHPLFATLKNLEQENCDFSRIHLNPLNLTDIIRLIADTLQSGKRPVSPLAELVVGKTGGNPFFVNQFLIMLYQEQLLNFNAEQGCWEWNLPNIRALDITDNVVELLLRRLEIMPADTQTVMMMAACIGSNFDLKSLRTITGFSDSEIIRHLLPAIREDLVVTITKNNVMSTNEEILPAMAENFKFRHDRVRQASYALIADENKKPVHLKIGGLLFENIAPHLYEENIFDMIHHLNMAADLICDLQERDETAELNLVAGNKAKTLAAFEPALSHYTIGLQLLDENSWQRRYNLTLKLHVECAEAARLCGKFTETQRLFDVVMQNARTVLDRVEIYQTRILSLISEDRRIEAIGMTREILKKIGVDLPTQPTIDDIHQILEETIADLSGTNVEDLADLPEMTDPSKLAAMKIMGSIFGASYQLSRDWFVILVCQQVKLSIQYGNFSNSAIAYSGFGIILCGHVGDIETGHRFGRLGLELLNRFDARELEAEVYTIFYAGINHWKFHLRESLEPLFSAHHTGLETGDYEFATYCTFFFSYHSFLCGNPLEDIERQMARFTDDARHHKQMHSDIYFSIFHQAVLNLLEKNEKPCSLAGGVFDETTMEPMLYNANDTLALFYMHFCKTLLCYLFETYPEAIKHAGLAEKLAGRVPGNVVVPVCSFYDSLSRLAVYETLTDEEQNQTMARVETSQFKMKKWMEHAPANYAHKFFLVEAEKARVLKQNDDAVKHYDRAICLARENGYVNEEALANELAAKFWLKRDRHEFAGIFMQKAYACYSLWGASRKIEHLLEKYHPLLSKAWTDSTIVANNASLNKPRQIDWNQQGLDLATLMKASQAISSEILLDNLLRTMMKIVIENAGAEKGFLLLNSKDRLRVAASGVADAKEVFVQSFDSATEKDEKLSLSVVNYAARTRECVVLKNAVTEGRFSNDPYIRKQRPKSVLCIPIIYQSTLTGVIYLENRLTPDVFSPDRIEVLKLLTSQIAISIENTMLFEKHRTAEEKYRSIFENAVEGIFLVTTEGQFVSANPSMAQILGYDSPEELCRQITDIEHQLYTFPEQRDKTLRMLRKNETVADFEVSFRRKDGNHIWVSLSARSIYDENGKLFLIEGFIIDISERKSATDALREREENLRKENIRLRSDIKDRFRFGRIIGKSPAMQEVYELILKAATTDASVIIYGESGTGKELVAREIHEMGDRKNGNFVPVNCGALPENLLESEFFGYKKGAFTGANADKKGFLDLAHAGTLFLDELGEISLNFQVKLLRALEDGSYTPLGSQKTQTSDARVVAATNRDLQEAIRKGLMREDFFYRVHIIPIHLPPLRDRAEDIPLLIEHFLKTHSQHAQAPSIPGNMLEALLSHDWPGNVRELQNVLHRYYTLGKIDLLTPSPKTSVMPKDHLPDPENTDPGQDHQSIMENTEKNIIIKALELHQWNRKNAAAHTGIPLRSFYRKLKQYNIIQGG